MTDTCDKLERYLDDTLGIRVAVAPWEAEGRMPLFLRDRYRFFWAEVLNQRCVFMVDDHAEVESPAAIRKHVEQVREKWVVPVVYVRDRIIAYNRKRLIEHKLPFIVPGTQMYLPTLGIDLREHFRRLRADNVGLRPAAQAVLIHALQRDAENLGPTVLAEKLGYSIMTMSRALDELEAAGLGRTTANGRERRLRLAGSKREIWAKAQPLLRSPVVKRHAIRLASKAALPGPRTGLDALAHYSMLAEPGNVAVALGREAWKSMQRTDRVEAAMMDEPGTTTVEVWSYAPAFFADGGWVDRLSLYLSLREAQDERVQAALDQMIKEVAW
jgi:DNA-binding MarR family transcriptional regulator